MPSPVTKAIRLARLYERIAKAHPPLVKPAKKFSAGDPDSPLMVVFGHALTDLQGEEIEYLNTSFDKVGLDKKKVFFSYAIRGSFMRKLPDGHLLLEHRSPHAEEVEAYRSFLLDEVSIVNPAVVLCVGSTAIKTLLGDLHFSVVKMAGAELDVPGIACPVLSTVSFSYVVKTGGKHSKAHTQFIGDLAHARALSLDSTI